MATAFGCYKNTIRLRSGKYFDLLDPQPDSFTFSDIAGALSKVCRFGGQIERFYSVAEHCWHCCDQGFRDNLSIYTQRALLLHDAAEAFIGDCVKPLKVMMPQYKEIEERVEAAIYKRFAIDIEHERSSVEKIDREMLIAERHALFTADGVTWTGENEVRRLSRIFDCWNPTQAERFFTEVANAIGIDTRA